MDDPSLLTVRRSLLHKLDEIANTPKHTPHQTPNDTPKHTPKHTPSDTPRQTPDLSMSSSPNTSGLVTPDSPPPYRGEIDTRTFVRPRKKKLSPTSSDVFEDKETGFVYDNNRLRYERSPGRYEGNNVGVGGGLPYDGSARHNLCNTHNTALRNRLQQPPSSSNHGSVLALSSGSLGSEDDEHLSSASEGSYCRLADVEDVNTLARLQEESLKLPDPRAQKLAPTRPKVSRLPAPRGRVSAGSSQEDLLGPGYRGGNSSHASPRRSGDNWGGFSPPISPYTSNSSLNATSGGSNGLRLPSNHTNSYGYGSPAGSRGGSPAREIPTAAGRRQISRLPPPQVGYQYLLWSG